MFHRHFVSKQWQNLRMINLAYMENARAIRMKVSVIAEFIIEAFKVTSKIQRSHNHFYLYLVRIRFVSKPFIWLYNARSFTITSTTHITINHKNSRFDENNCATLYTMNVIIYMGKHLLSTDTLDH